MLTAFTDDYKSIPLTIKSYELSPNEITVKCGDADVQSTTTFLGVKLSLGEYTRNEYWATGPQTMVPGQTLKTTVSWKINQLPEEVADALLDALKPYVKE